jgi:hypothetical protein
MTITSHYTAWNSNKAPIGNIRVYQRKGERSCILKFCHLLSNIVSIVDEKMNMEHWCNDTGENAEVFGGKPVQVPLSPPQSPHGQAWDQNKAED